MNVTKILYVSHKSLYTLRIPHGTRKVDCRDNCLTELYVPGSVEYINCSHNSLRSLKLEHGVEYVRCNGNALAELYVPNTIKLLHCDKGVIDPQQFMNSEIDIFIA
jgi:hypothetical protein